MACGLNLLMHIYQVLKIVSITSKMVRLDYIYIFARYIWAMENRKGPLGELGQNLINCIFVVIEHVTCYCNALCIGTSMFH